MKKDYSKSIIDEAFRKAGWDGICDKARPVMLKRNFIIDSSTELEAGTLCTVKMLHYSAEDKNAFSIFVRLMLRFPYNTDDEVLTCNINAKNNSITVGGLYERFSFNELFEACDEETSEKIEEYFNFCQEYSDSKRKYNERTNTASVAFGAGTAATLLAMCFALGYASGGFAILFAVTTVVLTFLCIVFGVTDYDNTVKGVSKQNSLSALSEELIGKEKMLIEQFENV